MPQFRQKFTCTNLKPSSLGLSLG